jgi:glycosyltransferase involved in cell wall biosynthesis
VLSNCKDYEIVIVDDGSTDNSSSLIQEFVRSHPEIRVVVVLQENLGSASARNAGLEIASGDLVFFCDSDDTVFADSVWAAVSSDIKFDILIGNYVMTRNQKGTPYFTSYNSYPANSIIEEMNYATANQLLARKAWWANLYRKDYLIDTQVKFIPTFEEAGGFFVLDDLFFLFQVYSEKPTLMFSDEIFYSYTQPSDGHDQKYLNQLYLQPSAAGVYKKHILQFEFTHRNRASRFMIDRLIGSYRIVGKNLSTADKIKWGSATLSFIGYVDLREKLKLPVRILKMFLWR